MFSQVEFKNLDINWYAKNILLLFEAFLKGLNDHKYPLIFDNLKYEDLFDETLIRKRIIQESKSKINSELWKYLSNWKITRKPMVNPLDDRDKGDLIIEMELERGRGIGVLEIIPLCVLRFPGILFVLYIFSLNFFYHSFFTA